MSIFTRLRRTPAADASARLLTSVERLIAQLRAEGRHDVADELARAWQAPEGASAGWAMFVECLDGLDGAGRRAPAREARLLGRIRTLFQPARTRSSVRQ